MSHSSLATPSVTDNATPLTLIPSGPHLWLAEAPFKFLGAQLGNRMSVIVLNNSQLLLHSPLQFHSDLQHTLNALGQVKYLLAPNCEHNLYFKAWQTAYPDAMTLAPPDIKKVKVDTEITPETIPELIARWQDDLTLIPINGMRRLNEIALLHHPSKTLLLTDLAFYITNDQHRWTQLLCQLYGIHKHFGPTRLIKSFINNKANFRQSIELILQHDFERIVISHGDIIEHDAKALFLDRFTL